VPTDTAFDEHVVAAELLQMLLLLRVVEFSQPQLLVRFVLLDSMLPYWTAAAEFLSLSHRQQQTVPKLSCRVLELLMIKFLHVGAILVVG